LGEVEELQEVGDSEASGEEVGRGGRAQEIAAGFPEMIAVHDDMLEGITATTVGTSGVIAGSGTKEVRVVRVKSVTRDELETRGLEGPGLSEKDPLGEGGE